MNKLLLAEDKIINAGEYELTLKESLNITVEGETKLYNYTNNDFNLNLSLKDNAKVKFAKVSILHQDLKLTFNLTNNTDLDFTFLIINEGQNKVTITINTFGNNNKAKLKIHSINKNESSLLDIICNAYINKNTKDNEVTEDLKGLILKNDTIKISPNIYVDTNEVLANHLVTIGSFNPEELFYLTSKGLTQSSAKKLLLESFTTNFITAKYKENILKEVTNIE